MSIWQHADSGKILLHPGTLALIEHPTCPCCSRETTLSVVVADVVIEAGHVGVDGVTAGYFDLNVNGTHSASFVDYAVIGVKDWEAEVTGIIKYYNGVTTVTLDGMIRVTCKCGAYYAHIYIDNAQEATYGIEYVGEVENVVGVLDTPMEFTEPDSARVLDAGTITASEP